MSGGEKQRISIARAMMKKSSIILLDEATSSLDSDTESKIQNALSVLTKDRTTIVIAHRLSTILNSNNIYVIDAGRVVASGKHENIGEFKLYKTFATIKIEMFFYQLLLSTVILISPLIIFIRVIKSKKDIIRFKKILFNF